MYKCKKCGYKTSFKMLMVNHIKNHNLDIYKSCDGTIIDSFILSELSESFSDQGYGTELCESSDSFNSSNSNTSEGFRGGEGNFGGGGSSGTWESD